ncbi:MAG TPA: hypothetical protein VF253_14490 [Candidatus Limnocylindrales bacterium]|jgi:hypothetical protein
MRKILSSVFVIVSVLGIGIFSTGAYFTDTITQDNYTFTTSAADLKFEFCGPVGINCAGTPATRDNIFFTTSQETGPGKSASDCLVIENTGNYALGLSSQLFVTESNPAGMQNVFEVKADRANSSCQPTALIRDWASAAAEQAAGQVGLGITLQPGERLYVITYNRWNSVGDQNTLENGILRLKTVLEGKTA